MRIRHYSIPFLAALALVASHANAANILWVQNNDQIDAGWKTLLEANGHTLTAFTTNRGIPTQAEKDFVNSFDLVVLTRSAFNAFPTGTTQLRDAGPVWNTTVTKPIIMMQAYLPAGHFSSNWDWTTTRAGGIHPTSVNGTLPMTVNDATDPIWTGITVSNGNPTPEALHTSNSHTIDRPLPSGAVVVASSPVNNNPLIVRYPAGTAAGPNNLAGERLIFSMRSDNDGMNLTELGQKVLLNAITSLTTGFPPELPFQLTITKNAETPGTFNFEWASQPGKVYDLLSSTDLATPIAGWPVYSNGGTLFEAIPTAGETTTLAAVPSADPRRFFAVRESDAPPPPPLLSVDFEENNGGFTASTTQGSIWEWGVPDTNNGFGGVVTAGSSGTKCWGTVLGSFTTNGTGFEGFYVNPTTTVLRSPVINLTGVTGASLAFAEALDTAGIDTAQVFVIDNADGSAIGGALYTATDANPDHIAWQPANGGKPISLPAAALGKQVYLEWRFTGSSNAFAGWYLDDVVVSQTTP